MSLFLSSLSLWCSNLALRHRPPPSQWPPNHNRLPISGDMWRNHFCTILSNTCGPTAMCAAHFRQGPAWSCAWSGARGLSQVRSDHAMHAHHA